MTFSYSHRRSAVLGKAPQPADIEEGEIAINTETPELYTKDARGNIVKVIKGDDVITLQIDGATGAVAPLNAMNGDPFSTFKGCFEWIMAHSNVYTKKIVVNVTPGTYNEANTTVKWVQARLEIKPTGNGVNVNIGELKIRDCADIQFENMTINCTKIHTQKNTFLTLAANTSVVCSDRLELDYPSVVMAIGVNVSLHCRRTILVNGYLVSKTTDFTIESTVAQPLNIEVNGSIIRELLPNSLSAYGSIKTPGADIEVHIWLGASVPTNHTFWLNRPKFVNRGGDQRAPIALWSDNLTDVMLSVTGSAQMNGQPWRPYVSLTQTAYDALTPPDPDTLYVITGP